jgi:hypothetical protein
MDQLLLKVGPERFGKIADAFTTWGISSLDQQVKCLRSDSFIAALVHNPAFVQIARDYFDLNNITKPEDKTKLLSENTFVARLQR